MIECLSWDSEFFQRRIGRLDLTADRQPDWAGIDQYDLLYILLQPGKLPPEELRVHAVKYDTKVVWKKEFLESNCKLHPNIREMRIFSPQLLNLGYQSGWCSRFFRDERLNARAYDMYRIWIEKYLADSTAATYVYETAGKIAGMINCKIQHEEGIIGLFAVDQEFRGQGIGNILEYAAEYFYWSRNVSKCQVVTQLENDSAMRAYQRYGYQICSQTDIWHWWKQ